MSTVNLGFNCKHCSAEFRLEGERYGDQTDPLEVIVQVQISKELGFLADLQSTTYAMLNPDLSPHFSSRVH